MGCEPDCPECLIEEYKLACMQAREWKIPFKKMLKNRYKSDPESFNWMTWKEVKNHKYFDLIKGELNASN